MVDEGPPDPRQPCESDIMGARSWFIPQEKQFFEMILKQAENVVAGVDAYVNMLEHFEDRDRWKTEINKIEGIGDKMVHDIFEEVNRTFITPIDREDITLLTSSLDDILDYVEASAVALVIYRIQKPPKILVELAATLSHSIHDVRDGISLLKDFKNATKIYNCIKEINTHENEADALHRTAMCELFEGSDAIYIIKMKEIYDNTETATDKCEDVADVLGDILVKYT